MRVLVTCEESQAVTIEQSDVLDYIGVEWQPQLSMFDLAGEVVPADPDRAGQGESAGVV